MKSATQLAQEVAGVRGPRRRGDDLRHAAALRLPHRLAPGHARRGGSVLPCPQGRPASRANPAHRSRCCTRTPITTPRSTAPTPTATTTIPIEGALHSLLELAALDRRADRGRVRAARRPLPAGRDSGALGCRQSHAPRSTVRPRRRAPGHFRRHCRGRFPRVDRRGSEPAIRSTAGITCRWHSAPLACGRRGSRCDAGDGR